MKLYETIARYLLGIIFLYGAVDGILFLFFDISLHGELDPELDRFLLALQSTTYFWALLKFIQLVGALSLLSNYKPALGLALITPVSAVLCLFYVFELRWYIAFTVVAVLNLVLLRAYWSSFSALLKDYPMRRKVAEKKDE